MRDRFPLVVIGGLALLAIAGSYLLRGAARGGFADAYSTWRSEPDGARGVYLLALETGLRVGRHQADLELLEPATSYALIGVAPDELTADELEKLLAHVARGNALLYAPAEATTDPLLAKIGVTIVPVEGSEGVRPLVPVTPSPWTLGVSQARAEVTSHVQEYPTGSVPLLIDDELGGTVAALVPWEQGQIVVISAPALAWNKHLAEADNAQLWLSLLRTASRIGPVLFDEFHHGFTDDRSIAAFAARYGLHFAILQLLFGVSLWALAMRRFGRPQLPKEEERIGSHDALFASSRIYREGRHHGWAASLIARELTQHLAQHVNLPAHAQLQEVLDALGARNEDALAEALRDVHSAARNAASESDVQACATRAAQIRTTLHQRHRSAA